MKRITASLILCAFPAVLSAGNVTVDNLEYQLSNSTASVASWQDVSGDIVIPSAIWADGTSYTVNRVDDYAFSGCIGLTSISFPSTVTQVGSYAFSSCTSLRSVRFEDSDQPVNILSGAAGGQSRGLFYDCPVETLYIGRTLQYLSGSNYGYSPFYNRKALVSVTLGENVTELNNYLFYGAESLTSVTVPAAVYKIGNYTFAGCTGLTGVVLPDMMNSLGNYAFSGCSNLQGTVIVPSHVATLSKYAFENCSRLSSIVVSNGVKTIQEGAFTGCSSLSEVIIPGSVTSIGESAFDGCSGVTSLLLADSESQLSVSGEIGVFSDMNLETAYIGRTFSSDFTSASESPFQNQFTMNSVTIGSKVTYISSFEFAGCMSLESIVIPSNVDSVGNNAFDGCFSLSDVRIDDAGNTLKLGSKISEDTLGLFYDCSLEKLYMGRDVWYEFSGPDFGYAPFALMPGLYDFSVGNQVTVIPDWFLYGDMKIRTLTVPANIIDFGYNSVSQLEEITLLGSDVIPYTQTKSNTIFFIPDEALSSYCANSWWKSESYKFVPESNRAQIAIRVNAKPNGPALRDALGDDSMMRAYDLKISGSINGYDILALRNKFVNLRYLDLSEASITANDDGCEYYTGYSLVNDDELDDYAFYGLGFRSVSLPASLTRIGKNAFADCENLTSVANLPAVRTIDDNAFEGCSNLESFDFSSRYLTAIGKNAFRSCLSLNKMIVETGRKLVIGENAFSNCESLDTLYLESTNSIDISREAFRQCYSLSYANLGNGVKSIGNRAFEDCSWLENLQFGRNLISVGDTAFSCCFSLETVSLPTSLQTIGQNAFEYCTSMRKLKLPSSLLSVGNYAFTNCPLDSVYTYTIEPINIDQSTFSSVRTCLLFVPNTSFENYYSSTQWGRFLRLEEFDEPYEYFYLNGDLELSGENRIDGTPDLTMNATSGITVTGSSVQSISTLEYNHNGVDGASIIAGEGESSNVSIASVNVNIGVEANRWYFLCFPFDVPMDSVECSSEYVIYSYNGEKRADGESGWQYYSADSLSNNTGYIFCASQSGILTIHVDGRNLKLTADNASTSLSEYSSSQAQNASWNFIGNPFICYYDIKDLASEYNAPIIIWNPNTNSYDAYRPGDEDDEDDYQLHPFEAFFIQKASGETAIEFMSMFRQTGLGSAGTSSLRSQQRRTYGSQVNPDRLFVNIALMNEDSLTDRTRIVFNDKASACYEIGCDAAKFKSEAILQLYSINSGVNYAINERPAGEDEIQLGYQVAKAGTYHLTVPRMDADVQIYDAVEKQYIDFRYGDYMFQSPAGRFDNRFILTYNGGITSAGGAGTLHGVTAVPVDGGIMVTAPMSETVRIYTADGRLAAVEVGEGFISLPQGTYIVCAGNGNIKITVE